MSHFALRAVGQEGRAAHLVRGGRGSQVVEDHARFDPGGPVFGLIEWIMFSFDRSSTRPPPVALPTMLVPAMRGTIGTPNSRATPTRPPRRTR